MVRRRPGRYLRRVRTLAATLAVLATTAGAGSAHACSCVAPGDPRADVDAARAAFYGTVVDRRVHGRRVTYRFTVKLDIKNNLGRQVTIRTTTQTAACGLDLHEGQRIGLLLSIFKGRYIGSSCSVRTKRQLQLGGSPEPRQDGTPPPGFLVGGAFGTSTVATLDAGGHLLAFGGGRGSTTAVAACPGSTAALQGVSGLAGDRNGIVVRDMATLRPRSRVVLPDDYVTAVHCLAADGSRALVVGGNGDDRTRLLLVDHGKVRALFKGGATWFAFAGSRVWLSGLDGVRTIDADSGDDHRLALPDKSYVLSVSPSGTVLAVQHGRRLRVVGALDGTVLAGRSPAPYEAAWITDDRLAVSRDPGVTIFDAALHRVKSTHTGYSTLVPTATGQLALLGNGIFNRVDAEGIPVQAKTLLFTTAISVATGVAPPPAATTAARRTPCWVRQNRRIATQT
ncbi:MAG: hypothetical protein QOF76_3297 [Solirubrobacteraceae bacterium]|nr:hypothetical protein [Solirubrobacteraceae bacterium]